jgi:hypothetical protein
LAKSWKITSVIPEVSLEFFIDIILLAALWLWVALGLTQPLIEMSTMNISWGVKAAGACG